MMVASKMSGTGPQTENARLFVSVSPEQVNKKIESIRVAGVTARISPIGLHIYAKDFLQAAVSLDVASTPFSPVRGYLLAHAVELGLKAFLSAKGTSLEELAKKYGHSLKKLLCEAESLGMTANVPFTAKHVDEIRRANEYYDEKVFEYPALPEAVKGYRRMPDLEVLRSAAELLVTRIEALCLDAS